MFNKAHITLFFVGILFSFLSFAQDSIKRLPSVTITHESLPYSIASLENASPEYSLNEYFLNMIGAKDIGEGVKYVPGVQVKDYGGIGGIKTVSYRSLGATHTGVTLDNNSIVNSQIGAINLSSFESFGLKEITFSSGQPKSSFALPSAYVPASLIQIYSSLLSMDSAFTFRLYQNLTTINAYESAMYVGLPIKDKWKVGVQLFAKHGNGRYDYTYNLMGTDDVYRRTNSTIFNYKGRFALGYYMDGGIINVSGYHSKVEQELPGAVILFNPSNDQKLFTEDSRADVDFTKIFNDVWVIRTNANIVSNYTRYEDPTFLNTQGFISSSYRQNRQGAGFIISRYLNRFKNRIFAGIDGANSSLSSSEFTNNPNRLQFNSVLGAHFKLNRWTFESNMSHQMIFDKARSSDTTLLKNYSKFSPYVAISVLPFKKRWIRFRAFYKMTFRMPTFNDLYYNFIGNTNLKPESAHLFNAGANWSIDLGGNYIGAARANNFEVSVDGFANFIQNKIVAVPTKDLFNWSMQNIGNTRIIGTDISMFYSQKVRDFNWSITTSLTYNSSIDVTDKTSPSYGHQIPYTPVISGSVTAVFGWKGYQIESGMMCTGTRYSLNENIPINKLDPFIDLDLGLSKKFNLTGDNFLGVNLKVMNLLNKNYEVIRSFPMPGRYYQLTLRYSYK